MFLKKISKGLRFLIVIGLIILAVLFAVAGRFLLSLPLTLASLALLKLKRNVNYSADISI